MSESQGKTLNTQLTANNFSKGFLIDETYMGGVSELEDGRFAAFIIENETANYKTYQEFLSLSEALSFLNGMAQPWSFQKTAGCGSGACENGECRIGGCSKTKPSTDNSELSC